MSFSVQPGVAGMHRFNNMMPRRVNVFFLAAGIPTPQNENHRILFVKCSDGLKYIYKNISENWVISWFCISHAEYLHYQHLNHTVGKYFPANFLMRIGSVSNYCKGSVQQQNTLVSPRFQISVVWDARKNTLTRRGIILLNRCIPARCQHTMAFSGANLLAVPTRCWSRWEKRRLTGRFRIFKKRMKLEMQR